MPRYSYQSSYSVSEGTLNNQPIYGGNVADYQEGWEVVATTVKKIAP